MIHIDNHQIIQVSRGDDFDIEFHINMGTPLHPVKGILEDNEYLYFGVMEPGLKWENSILRKKLSVDDLNLRNNVLLHLNSEDTENLVPGLYYYMVKVYIWDVELNKYIINTIIPSTKFFVYE